MLDTARLLNHADKRREGPLDCVVISLMFILKGLVGIIHHLHAVVRNIASKLKVRWCVKRYNCCCA